MELHLWGLWNAEKTPLKSLSGAGVQYGVIWIPLNPPPNFIVIADISSD